MHGDYPNIGAVGWLSQANALLGKNLAWPRWLSAHVSNLAERGGTHTVDSSWTLAGEQADG